MPEPNAEPGRTHVSISEYSKIRHLLEELVQADGELELTNKDEETVVVLLTPKRFEALRRAEEICRRNGIYFEG